MAGLDLTFDGDGRAITDLGGSESISQLLSVGNGKILAVASKTNTTTFTQETILVRYNANGSLDTSFGTGGQLITGLRDSRGSLITDDGKILIVGANANGSSSVIRYLANGQLDTSFGTSGKYTSNINDSFYDISIRKNPNNSTNEIILNGQRSIVNSTNFTTVSSSISLRLGVNGQVQSLPINNNTTAAPIAWDTTVLNQIISSATVNLSNPGVQNVVNLLGQGTIDRLRSQYAVASFSIQNIGIRSQNDGTILLYFNASLGTTSTQSSPSVTYLTRFGTNGNFDTSFGTNGLATFSIPTNEVSVAGSFDSTDRIYTASYNPITDNISIFRIAKNGSLDSTFGTNGKLTLPGTIGSSGSSSDFFNTSILIDSQNRIIVSTKKNNENFINVSRINNNGTIDATFGTNGKLQLATPNGFVSSVILGADDRIFLGSGGLSGDLVVTKYDITGIAPPLPPVISFSNLNSFNPNFSNFSVNENGVPINQVTLIRSGDLTQAVSVTIKLESNGFNSATPTVDYNAADIQVTFAPNQSTKTISIPIVDDNIADSNETIRLSLVNPTGGATLGSLSTATLTIVDNDFIGGSGNDTINGTAGNDIISGLDGDDTINPRTGKDTIDGGAGNDFLSIFNYSDTANITIFYTTATNGVITGGSNNGTTFKNIERLNITTGSGADNIDISATTAFSSGSYSPSNYIYSGAGNDIIKGGAGNDDISSGIGNHTIDGGAGYDSFSIGDDTQSGGNYLDTANTTVSYTTATNGLITGGSNNGTTFKNIERLNIVTGSGADNIDISATTAFSSGSDFRSNEISSGAGNDIIKGGAGGDSIRSGIGSDTIDGGAGSDTLSIYNDSDTANTTVSYTTVANGLITGGFNNGTTFKNIETLTIATGSGADNIDISATTATANSGYSSGNFISSGAGHDTIKGGAGGDNINSGTGNDTINGLGGRDSLTGGAGNDLFILGDATKTYYGGGLIDFNGDYEYARITDFVSTQDKVQLQGSASNYRLEVVFGSTDLYLRGANNSTDKKIATFQNVTGLNLSSSAFQYVGNTVTTPTITLAVAPQSVTEDGTTNLTYTFTRTGATTNALTVNYGVGGTATLGTDYTRTGAGTVTFAAGAATAIVMIDPTADTMFETAETVALTLAGGAGYTIGTTTAITGTITNDDTQVTLAVAPATVNEDGTTNLVYTFTRAGVTTNALTVNYGVGGTATLGTDYAQTGAATFAATAGTVTLTLASGAGYTVGTTNAITGTITNDDTQVTLAVAPLTVNEDGTTNLVYTFTRTGVTTNALTVNYGVGGTATLGTDYAQTGAASFTATTGTVTFAAGATTAIVMIDPTTDTVVEANETVALTLASGAGYTVGTTTAITGTITNDDIPPAISIADLIIVEGINGNPSQSLITVSLNKASSQAVGVNYATSNVTAIAGTDYTATSGILTFAAGELSKTIAVPILNDNLNEANETFSITLTTPTNATIADNQATITITDTISASITTILPALVENITLTGTAAINTTGNNGNNVITGNAANNTLTGLNGNDTYVYDADLIQGTDTITETITGGIDTLDLSQTAAVVNINLGLTTTQTVNGNLKLVIPVITLENFIGGSGNDRITGNSLDNTLNGGSGDDRIFAGGGNDFLVGGSGNDVISGGAGNDIFAYNGLLSGATTSTGLFGVDAIYDFTSTQDKISLSKGTFGAITSLAGTAIGANFTTVNDDSLVEAQSAAIVYSLSSGGLFYNQNGNATGLGTNGGEFANILGSATLVGSDFTIVT